MITAQIDLGLVLNPASAPRAAAPAGPFTADGFASAATHIAAMPSYAPTPLHDLSALAAQCDVGAVLYKDEGERFGLGSFKPLGAPYAAANALAEKLAPHHPAKNHSQLLAGIVRGSYAADLANLTLVSATDGNHGRALSWAARQFGAKAHIFAHDGMSDGRREAITALGATLTICPGGYDDSVRKAFAYGAQTGSPVIQDTAAGDYRAVPEAITYGYGTIASEVVGALHAPPTHAIVQAGVGGVASAICAAFWHHYGADRPRFIVLEPVTAACVAASLAAGCPVTVPGDTQTAMAGLACGTVSDLAWEVLHTGADAALIVPAPLAFEGMRALATPHGNDPALVGGECAGGAVGALLALSKRPDLRAALGLDAQARVFLLGTEGATDASLYEEIVGRAPESVMSAAA